MWTNLTSMSPCRILSWLFWPFILAATSVAQTPAQIQSAGRFYEQHGGFNGSVTVIRDGRLIANNTYGFANFESKTPLTPNSRMFIGSVTKQFTAAAVLLLQEEGRLRTSDPISRFYKDAPPAWNGITLHNLLTHTSGLPDDLATPGFPELEHGVHTPQQVVRAIADKPLKFAPGTSAAYTNVEYVLLGLVIEVASGQSYAQFLQQHIFDPLRMKDTGYISDPSAVLNRAYGYSPSAGGVKRATETPDAASLLAAGAMYSTGADLAKWLIALHDGKLLKAASYAEMVTPDRDGYAYGLSVSTQYGGQDVGHLGDVPGFHTSTEYFPASRTGIIVISNVRGTLGTSGATPGAYSIANELMALANDSRSITRSSDKEATVSPATLAALEGEYQLQGPGQPHAIYVEMENGILTLALQRGGKDRLSLRTESATRFYTAESPKEVEFSKTRPGALNMMLFDYANETATQWSRISK
jgi:CubicO group peptidase (beta-lactamase class C family)